MSVVAVNGQITYLTHSVAWTIDAALGEITFSVTSSATGYISVALSPSSTIHRGSNCYSGWVTGSTFYLLDGWLTTKTNPANNAPLFSWATPISGSQTTAGTTFSFKRKLILNNPTRHYDITAAYVPTYVSIAWQSTTDGNPAAASIPQHTSHVVKTVYFYQPAPAPVPAPSPPPSSVAAPPGSGTSQGQVASSRNSLTRVSVTASGARLTGTANLLSATAPVPVPGPNPSPNPVTNMFPVSDPVDNPSTVSIADVPRVSAVKGSNSVTVGEDGKLVIRWTFDKTVDQIAFELTFQGTGWASVGWSDKSSGHSGTESVIAWVDTATGISYFYEGISNDPNQPDPLTNSLISNKEAAEANGVTTIKFTRAISPDGYLSLDKQLNLAWAYSFDDGFPDLSIPAHDSSSRGVLTRIYPTTIVAPIIAANDDALIGPGLGVTMTAVFLLLLISAFRFIKYVNKKRIVRYYHHIAHGDDTSVLPVSAPKSTTGGVATFRRMIGTRAPMTQSPYSAIIILLIYVLLCVGWVVKTALNKGLEKSGLEWGYVSSATSLFVAVLANRNSILYLLLREPFERTLPLHRMLGRLLLIIAAVHGVLELKDYKNFLSTFSTLVNLYGYVSGVLLLLIVVLSLPWVRRICFNSFLWTHILLYLGFFVFAYLHAPKVQLWYTAVAIGLWLGDKGLRWWKGMQSQVVLSAEVLPGNAIRIRFVKKLGVKYLVGQYVYVNIPIISEFEWHPFTLSSGPNQDYCELTIKATGDFTKLLRKLVSKTRGTIPMGVDGPYGKLSMSPYRYDALILAGGGVGVTPAISILNFIYAIDSSTGPSKQPRVRRIYFIWVIPSMEEFKWFEVLFNKIQTTIQESPGTFPQLVGRIHLTQKGNQPAPENRKEFTFLSGRPSMEVEITTAFSEFKKFRQRENMTGSSSIGAYCCGSKKMSNDFWEACHQTSNLRIDVDVLTF